MNVLVIGKFYTEGFALHIAETLEDMGHKVTRFEFGSKATRGANIFFRRINQVRRLIYQSSDAIPAIRARHVKSLWPLVTDSKPDIIIVCHDFLYPNEVTRLKQMSNATIALWFPDALVNFGKGYFMNAPYDALFFKDPFIVMTLSGVLQSKVYYLPECFNPKTHHCDGMVIEDNYHCDITTAGNAHSWRIAFYQHLTQYNVKIWGPPAPLWMPKSAVSKMLQNKEIHNQEKAKAFLGAKIVLNNLHYGEIWGLNVRTFEAAGIGAFQMVDWRLGLKQLFKDGEEIISFKNIADMYEKINYYLHNPEKRKLIAEAGKFRAYKEHTYELRLSLLLATLNHTANGFPLPEISTE